MSPPPHITPTPNPLPQYVSHAIPEERDYALDFEAVMTAIGDFNSDPARDKDLVLASPGAKQRMKWEIGRKRYWSPERRKVRREG